MIELLNTATSHVNIVLTFFLVFTLAYWLLMIIGLVDIESVDIDMEMDTDLDIDTDIDVDLDVDTDIDINTDVDADFDTHISGSSPHLDGLGDSITKKSKRRRKWYHVPMAFMGIGTIPLMIVLSTLFITMWIISIIITQKFGIQSWGLGLLSLIPTFIAGLIITKISNLPLLALFRKMKEGEAKAINFIGKTCKIHIKADAKALGQASVLINGDVIKIYVKTTNDDIEKGAQALIVDENKEKNYFIIEKFNNL